MKKRSSLLCISLIFLLTVSIVACAETPMSSPAPASNVPPTITATEVINIVITYGLPTFRGGATPVGDWSARNEGSGKWEAQGQVLASYPSGDYYYLTTWIYDGQTISLVSAVASDQIPRAQEPAYTPALPGQKNYQQDELRRQQEELREEQQRQMRESYLQQAEMYEELAQQAKAQYDALQQQDRYIEAESYRREYKRYMSKAWEYKKKAEGWSDLGIDYPE